MKIAGVALWIWGIGVLVGAGGLAALKLNAGHDSRVITIDAVKPRVEVLKKSSPQKQPALKEDVAPIWKEYLSAIQDEQRSINEDQFSSKTKAWGGRVDELKQAAAQVGNEELLGALRQYRHKMQMEHLNLNRLRNQVVIRKQEMDAREKGRTTRPRIVRNEEAEAMSDSELDAAISDSQARCERLLGMTIGDVEA